MLLTRRTPPRDAIRAGFFFALGAILLAVLALAARRFFQATLAVITPFVIGAALALLLDPLADRLEKRGMKRGPAAGLVFLGLLLVLGGIGYLVIPAVVQQAGNLAQSAPGYVQRLQDSVGDFLRHHRHIAGIRLPRTTGALTAQLSGRASALLQTASGHITGLLMGSVTLLIQTVLALILTFFFLVDIDRLRARILYLAPEKWRKPMDQVGSDIGGVFADYVRGLLIVCALYGVATVAVLYGLSTLHHELARYALLVGAAAGVLYAVPYVGSTATALVTFLVAFAAGGAGFGGIAVAATLALNQVFDNIVTPKVVGGGVGLHPVIAIFALVMGGELFGLWGMLLSVPIAASIQLILFRVFPKLTTPTPTRFLGDKGVPPDQEESEKIIHGQDSVTAQRQTAEQEDRPKTTATP